MNHVAFDKESDSTLEMIKLLLNNGAYVDGSNREYTPPLVRALISHNYQVLDLLLKHGSKAINFKHYLLEGTILHTAVQNGNVLDARFLIEHGANPLIESDAGETPLALAKRIHNDSVELIQVLTDAESNYRLNL